MRTIYLCGHTGSGNRGCEAIVRSTVAILRQLGEKHIKLMTFAPEQDGALGLELLPYPKKTLPQRAMSLFMRKVMGDGVWGQRMLYRDLLRKAGSDDLLFNIGGDTYCYGTPYISYALNEMAARAGIPTVFWGCTVDSRLGSDQAMQRDVGRYVHVVARDTASFERLQAVAGESVLLGCDPAFWLEAEETALPEGFLSGNTVGINLSPLIDGAERSAEALIRWILDYTDMAVCLISHVPVQDAPLLGRLQSKFAGNSRICKADSALNSCQLKYIISKCRFFVGARTHAVIAAYSSGVPALALSYSEKSLAIAKDLFGQWEGFALKDSDELTAAFEKIMTREEWFRQRYAAVLPEYRQRILNAAGQVLEAHHEK